MSLGVKGFLVLISVVSLGIPAALAQDEGQPDENLIGYDEVVQLLLENSFEVQLSWEEINAAARQVENALRAYYPKIRLQSSVRADLLDLDEFSSDDASYGLILDWNPYQSGEILRMNAEARLNFYISKINREQMVIDLVTTMQELYYDLLKTQYDLEAEETELEVEYAEFQIKEKDFESGDIKKSDLMAARTEYYEKELETEKARQLYNLKMIQLKDKIRHHDFDRLADVDRRLMTEMDFSAEDCVRTSYLRQRKYIIAKERENLARLAVRYAKLKRLPTLSFFTTSDYALDQTAAGQDFGFRVGLSASYPLYDAGERAAVIESAKSYYRKAEIDRRKEKDNAALSVREKYYGLKSQLELLRLTMDREERFAEDWVTAQADFESGTISRLERDKVRNSYLMSRNRIRSLELDTMLAQSALLKAIGVSSFDEIIR